MSKQEMTARERLLADMMARPRLTDSSHTTVWEGWSALSSDVLYEGEISAEEAWAVGATIMVRGIVAPARTFHIKYDDRDGDSLRPWKLREDLPTGRGRSFTKIGEFSTMTVARAEARILARGAAGEPSS